VPLAVTLASEDIYHTFKGDEKAGMLLQGSSYTAHPVGCHVATVNVREMGKIESRGEWEWAKQGNGWNSVINDASTWIIWSRLYDRLGTPASLCDCLCKAASPTCRCTVHGHWGRFW
jgi:hypothetical protein